MGTGGERGGLGPRVETGPRMGTEGPRVRDWGPNVVTRGQGWRLGTKGGDWGHGWGLGSRMSNGGQG